MKFKHWLSLAIFIFLTIIITWPLILNPVSLASAAKEEFLLSYLMNWNIHALLHYPQKIFQAPFFYPIKDALAFSDPLFTNSLNALPFVKIFSQPFLAYNINLLLSFILNGFFTYLLIFKVTKNFWASLISGILFSFSIGRIDSLEHLQILSSYWLPLGLYFFLNHRFFLVVLCFLLQIFNTIFLGYVYFFTISLFTVIYWLKKKISKKQVFILIKYFSLSLIVVGLTFLPYWRVSKTWQYTRSLNDIKAGSAHILEYFYPTSNSRLQPLAQQIIYKQPWPAYLGFPISLLSLLAFIYFLKQKKTVFTLSSITIGLAGLIMSLGPYLQIIKNKLSLPLPLPYWLFYYLIPGFKSMRVPQRWSHLALFGFSLLIGLFISKLKPKKIKLLIFLIFFLVLIEIKLPLFNKPVSTQSQLPVVYQWLSQQPSSVVLELPAQTWVMPLSDLEIDRLHYHSFLFKANHQYINGYSGFEPPDWTKALSILRTSEPEAAINIIRQLGADIVIVHNQQLEELYQKDKEALPLKTTLETIDMNFNKIYTDEKTTVYQI